MKIVWRVVVATVLLVGNTLWATQMARAADVSPEYFINNQQYNRLISDGDFIDVNSMSVASIQAFLASQGSYLASAPPSQLGDGHRDRSAAQIIYDAAHGKYEAAGTLKGVVINESTGTISPKAILVTLQKEQSLITLGDYQPNRLNAAMGYGCPDAGGCNSSYAGFTKQVEWGSWQLRYNYEIAGKDASWWTANYGSQFQYRVGNGKSMSYSFSSPPMSGTVTVGFNNQATAGLYRYTPHITYGNYNFWKLARAWFNLSNEAGSGAAFNDTSSVELRTYGSSVKVSASKESGISIYSNGSVVASSGGTSWSHTISPPVGTTTYTYDFRNSSGVVGTKTVTVERRKQGDIDGSGRVDLADLSLLSNAWGGTIQGEDWRNLNPESDNDINLLDMSIFGNNWEG